jgi:hypothetical protein
MRFPLGYDADAFCLHKATSWAPATPQQALAVGSAIAGSFAQSNSRCRLGNGLQLPGRMDVSRECWSLS